MKHKALVISYAVISLGIGAVLLLPGPHGGPLFSTMFSGLKDEYPDLYSYALTDPALMKVLAFHESTGTPRLIYAVIGGRFDLVKYLVEVKGDDVNVKDKGGGTALRTAHEYGRETIEKYLLEHGAK